MATYARGVSQSPAVAISGLKRWFGTRTVLDDVDLEIADGQFVVLLGRSGSGKTTLLRAVAGLDHEATGTGLIEAPEEIAVIFQDARLLPWKRVLDNVVLGLNAQNAGEMGTATLAEVGLSGRERAWPNELSGGEQQRAALARALVRQPGLLLADEPFGALDALTRSRMHDLLRALCARYRPAVLLVTHDVDEAVLLADRVLVIQDGHIGVDQDIDIAGERSPRDPRFQYYRDQFLEALGVELNRPATLEPLASPSAKAGATGRFSSFA